MNIKKITIKNFRSINELSIPFLKIDNKICNILLGKNECGKSNILKAMSLLDKTFEVKYELDCNKNSIKENKDISVVYELDFDDDLIKLISNTIELDIDLIKIIKIEKKIDINSKNIRADYYHIYIEDKKEFAYYVFDKKYSIKKIETLYNGDEIITDENIATILPLYTILNKEKLEEIIEHKMESIIDEEIKVIYWEPSTVYLINEPINLNLFKDNFTLSVPLRNIFHIANIADKDIKRRIELIIENDEERKELSETLSDEITKYVNEKWTEHKISINVDIEHNLLCIVNVEDKDYNRPKYKMQQRSDGFIQFISILLSLSAENRASILKNKLILLDEPEVHLHPSGIKYLRDELLKISENNSLVISTHSTYMIDKLNLNRHFSVTKDKSITNILQIEENNPYEEEVLYESLGTSIFEFVTPIILIFEGKTDKDIFDMFSKRFKSDLDTKNISAISANGVETIEKYVKFFNKGLVKAFIVVDSDKAGQNVKKQIISQNDNYSIDNTFEINDLLSNSATHKTLEDLLPKEIIESVLKEEFHLTISLDSRHPYVEQIKTASKELNEKDLKLKILEYVNKDVSNLKITKLKLKEKYSLYFEFISNLYSKITS